MAQAFIDATALPTLTAACFACLRQVDHRSVHGDSSPYGPGSRRAAMEQLARPDVRATILQEAGERPEPAGWPPTQWCDLYPMGPGFDYEPGPDQSIASIAAARGEPRTHARACDRSIDGVKPSIA